MTTIIYSKENSQSVKRVENLKKQHPKFIYLELGETESVAEAIADKSVSTHMLDEPKKEKATPAPKKKEAPVVKATAAKKRGRPTKK